MTSHSNCGCTTKPFQITTGPWRDQELYDLFVMPELEIYFKAKMPHLDETKLKLQLCELIKFLVFLRSWTLRRRDVKVRAR